MSGTVQDRRIAAGLPGLEIRFAESAGELAAVLEVRRRVFGDEQRIADAGVSDPDDARSLQALAVVASGAIATARLTLGAGPGGEAQIAWVATLPGYRGRGVGSAVMRFLLAAADERGVPLVLLSAQTHALAFYQRLGFTPYG